MPFSQPASNLGVYPFRKPVPDSRLTFQWIRMCELQALSREELISAYCKRSAQACGMEARRAETQALPRLGSRQPLPAGARRDRKLRIIRAPHSMHPQPRSQPCTTGDHRAVGHSRFACWYCRRPKSGDSLSLL